MPLKPIDNLVLQKISVDGILFNIGVEMNHIFITLYAAVIAQALFIPTLHAERGRHGSAAVAPSKTTAPRKSAPPAKPPLPVPCDGQDIKKRQSTFILDPEIHDCDFSVANREKLIEKAISKELLVGLEGSGEEPAIEQIAQLNDPEYSAASLFFYALNTLEQSKQSLISADELASEMDQIAFGLGQYEFLQGLLPTAVAKAALGRAQPANKKISDLYTALSDAKLPAKRKEQLWNAGKKNVLQNVEYVRAFIEALASEYISYLEKPANKQRLQPPDSQIFRNFLAHPLDLKAQEDTYKAWIIEWRDQSMAKTALKLICTAAGKDVYFIPGMNHGPGVYALVQNALKAAGLDKQVTTKVARTLTQCPSYLSSLLNRDPDIRKYEAFLDANK
jgi:hypothetical protein